MELQLTDIQSSLPYCLIVPLVRGLSNKSTTAKLPFLCTYMYVSDRLMAGDCVMYHILIWQLCRVCQSYDYIVFYWLSHIILNCCFVTLTVCVSCIVGFINFYFYFDITSQEVSLVTAFLMWTLVTSQHTTSSIKYIHSSYIVWTHHLRMLCGVKQHH